MIMFAREELLAQGPFGEETLRRALDLGHKAQREGGAVADELDAWMQQLTALVGGRAALSGLS
jgi:hypothetical protein